MTDYELRHQYVLLVEDNDVHAKLISRAFEEVAGSVTLQRVGTGADAVEFLTNACNSTDGDGPPIMIFLDLLLPDSEEVDVIEFIRRSEALRMIPVIVLSTSSEPDDVRHAYNMGANAFVTKPVDFKRLEQYFRAIRQFWWETAVMPVR
jgi:CheY-like chemotaxis protein